ncbi:hypothetical protein LOY34_22980 [Pseudomonas sp. B21-009]|uniref:hypothetical protein n=1 Tax=Pseudomonas sp. B21-009 TaxID=2895470 RepID=UPI00215ED6DD|nr:hypothetical protein [Pseudomonas sp. B21-009]UVM66140.1 hypothetical protein LOY34_22980 [Pseudomonas sp. B21-009]
MSSVKKWRLVLIGTVSLFLAACEKAPSYEFEGTYFITEGENCTIPASAEDNKNYFLEITKQVHNGSVSYSAKLPSVAKAEMPITSVKNASPTKDNELTFSFTHAKVPGVMPGSSKMSFEISAVPNKNKENHLWLTKQKAIMVRDEKVTEYDVLDNLRRFFELGKAGACLRKGTATS